MKNLNTEKLWKVSTLLLSWAVLLLGILLLLLVIFLINRLSTVENFFTSIFFFSFAVAGVGLILKKNWARCLTSILFILEIPRKVLAQKPYIEALYSESTLKSFDADIIQNLVYEDMVKIAWWIIICLCISFFFLHSKVREQFK